MTNGSLPAFSFQDKDVILVKPIGSTVTVSEGARNSFTFELKGDDMRGQSLVNYAKPGDFISHVSVAGLRDESHFAKYTKLDEFSDLKLHAGDHIEFKNDYEI